MTRTFAPPSLSRISRPLRASGDIHRVSNALPEHLAEWQLPSGWNWGSEGLSQRFRHIQEVLGADLDDNEETALRKAIQDSVSGDRSAFVSIDDI